MCLLYKFFCIVLFLYGCTTVGLHYPPVIDSINFGKPVDLNLCVYKDTPLSKAQVLSIVNDWSIELHRYSIHLKLVKINNWKREHFFLSSELEDLLHVPLEEPCDRFVLFLSTTVFDSLFDLVPIGTILGAVEGYTSTKGYIIADYFSLNQIFSSPSSTMIHEGYHLFGCNHAILLTDCYTRILALKKTYTHSKSQSFFPAMNFQKEIFSNRKSVNDRLRNRNNQ